MADNVSIATDDVSGNHYQRIKVTYGGDGVAAFADAGAGAVGTGTARMTLGSDDPAVVALQIMDDWDDTDRCKVVTVSTVVDVTLSLDTAGWRHNRRCRPNHRHLDHLDHAVHHQWRHERRYVPAQIDDDQRPGHG